MTYGHHLDEAARALASALVTLQNPDSGGIADHAAVAIARTQFYRAIERQAAHLTARGDDTEFGRLLSQATQTTAFDLPLPPPSNHPLAVALRQAADAARAASEILDSHFDPGSGRPRSSEGHAILAGINRVQNLTHLAQLARAASEADRILAGWLKAGYAAGSHQPIVRTAIADARTTSAVLYPAASAIRRTPVRTPIYHLQPPLLTDLAQRWTRFNFPADCVTALDVTRTWLVQHHRNLTAADLNALTRTSLALSYETDYLIGLAQDRTEAGAIGFLARGWRTAARAASHLHSLTRPEPGIGPAVLTAAEAWLRNQLRPDGGWRNRDTLRNSPDAAAWRTLGRDLAARLPDLATLVHRAALAALHRGALLELDPRHRPAPAGEPVRRAHWIKAGPASPQGIVLRGATSQLRSYASWMAREAGVTALPGINESDASNEAGRRELRARLRRSAAAVANIGLRPLQSRSPKPFHQPHLQPHHWHIAQQQADEPQLDYHRDPDGPGL
ncbi:hypothetical protein ABZ671_30685 [Micromonospora sp. NPDC006766]|uniref:hypothetical protein n=1 Tax=Micromonospora sp. NPDC006766 TaxID=3154778 RepID=UPI0033CE0702